MIVDILVLLVLAVSALIAFMRGFIREILTIVGVLGGMIAAYYGGPHILPLMEGWLGVDPNAEEPQKLFDIIPYTYVAQFLAYGATFIVVVVILSIISHMIAEAVKSVGLGSLDRTLGIIFGLVRGALLLGILYLPVYLTIEKETTDQWFEGSKSFVYVEATAKAISEYLPEEARKSLEKQVEEGAEAAQQNGEIKGTLEKLDLLNLKKKNSEPQIDKGYSNGQREGMDQLIEDMNDAPAPAPSQGQGQTGGQQ